MVFTRRAILEPDIEKQLAKQMFPLWRDGMKAKQIAEELEFGEPPYKKLKKHHVYFYRTKFNKGTGDKGKYKHLKRFEGKFPRRRKAAFGKSDEYEIKNRYKDKKEKVMNFQTFKRGLNTLKVTDEFGEGYSRMIRRKRAYLILHFWTPLRKSEIFQRKISDFDLDEGFLKIDLYRKKKYYSPGADTEPFYLEVNLKMVNEVVDWIFGEEWKKPLRDENGELVKEKKTKKHIFTERPFDFTGWTAWRYVKDTFPTYYPHFFRSNYITRSIRNIKEPGALIYELVRDTGLDVQTIERYIMKNPRFRGRLNREQQEFMEAHGMI